MDGLGLSEAPQEMQQRLTSNAVNLAVSLQSEMIKAEGKALIMSVVSRLELTPKVDGYKLHIDERALASLLDISDINIISAPTIEVPLTLQTCNNGKKVIIRLRGDIKPEPNSILIEALRTAHVIKTRLTASKPSSMSSIASALETDVRQAWRMLKLAFLAPDIQLAILSGTHPKGLILKDLIYQPLPIDWNEQRRLLGFAA